MSLIMLSESLRLSKIYRLETKFFLQIKLTVKLGRKYYSYQLCVYAQLEAVWEKTVINITAPVNYTLEQLC